MERRGWIAAGIAALLVALGLYAWGTGNADPRPAPARLGSADAPDGPRGRSDEVDHANLARPSTRGTGRTERGDAGVTYVAPRTAPARASSPDGRDIGRGIPRSAEDADQSAGWRLGQARRRISILERREALYQAAVDRFVQEGNTDNEVRQRAILERVQRRLEGLREREQELATEADAEGTLGEVDRGFEEGETDRRGQSPVTVRSASGRP